MNAPSATHPLGVVRSDPNQDAARSAVVLLVVGAVEIVLGLIAIIWPAVAGVSIAILCGSLLLVAGVAGLCSALSSRGRHRIVHLLLGALALAAGVYLLVDPDEGLIGLTKLLAIVLLLGGVLLVAVALLSRENRGVLIAAGAVDVVLGVLIWAELPSSASWAIGLLVGVHFVGSGIRTTISGLDLRRQSSRNLGGAQEGPAASRA
jgi:uncharacterized membrane protein HdeD (DUF308 family)